MSYYKAIYTFYLFLNLPLAYHGLETVVFEIQRNSKIRCISIHETQYEGQDIIARVFSPILFF